ncbi:TonB-dependent receptor plug domain-containing protein [Sphingomonas psychrotolerans]|uniref:TonB-dependent receptor plug domain-containing protein n=1 Tax=Sphingomonas psychrotolerans TaxID=1327635 RepID=UPI001F3E0727|nr:TonB-dependent receptor plug domain-containing protein [Sphingomonas psychrotolerans]
MLSKAAVASSVSGDLDDVLAQLLPSFNVQRLPAADGQAFVRPATLRGLSADQTLVLLNGKRYHRSALLGSRGAQAPDLASIPTAGIGRVEVLRDGALAYRDIRDDAQPPLRGCLLSCRPLGRRVNQDAKQALTRRGELQPPPKPGWQIVSLYPDWHGRPAPQGQLESHR